jgi:hypothetical protein
MTVSSEPGRRARNAWSAWFAKKKPRVNMATLVATLISVVSAGAAIWQVQQATNQNRATEQQQLVTLVSSLAQVPALLAQEQATLGSKPASLQVAESGTDETQLADSEEAAALIQTLNGNGVTSDEYYEVAMGLQSNDSFAQATALLSKAAHEGSASSPRIMADIWRDEAQISYELSNVPAAEHYIQLAYAAFDGRQMSKPARLGNTVYTKLFDAAYQASISCSTAEAEVSYAAGLITKDGDLNTPGVVAQRARAETAIGGCHKPKPSNPRYPRPADRAARQR